MRDKIKTDMTREAIAAAELVAALSSDDEVLNHDMVEGETGLFEAVELALDEIRDYQSHCVGIADTIKALTDRKTRLIKRIDRLRGLIDQAFQMADVKSHAFPCETVTVKAVPPKLIVTDESQIPSEFFVTQPPKLDMKALKEAATAGSVEGATLSNGGTTIQIRRA